MTAVYALAFKTSALKEWQRLDKAVQTKFKKKMAESLQQPHVPSSKLAGLPNAYKIKLRATGFGDRFHFAILSDTRNDEATMTFLSGAFYLVDNLPEPFATISHWNPIFYMIDGFRFGFFGISDVSPWMSLAVVGGATVVVSLIALQLLRSGYKIRS